MNDKLYTIEINLCGEDLIRLLENNGLKVNPNNLNKLIQSDLFELVDNSFQEMVPGELDHIFNDTHFLERYEEE